MPFRRGWFDTLTDAQGRFWFRVVLGLVALFPVLVVSVEGTYTMLSGGVHWQQLAYSLWDQEMCVAIIVALLVLYRNRSVTRST